MLSRKTEHLRQELKRIRAAVRASGSAVSSEQLVELLELLQELVARLDAQEETFTRRQVEFDHRLLELENSRFFQLLRLPGRWLLDWRGRLGQVLLHSPLHSAYLKIARPRDADDRYQQWLQKEAPPAREAPGRQTIISIVMPVCDPQRAWLDETVGSVLGQTYPHWQLCVCDDASTAGWVGDYFNSLATGDTRIRFTRSLERLGISGATNRAGSMAQGEYVAFLDQDDRLAPRALSLIASAVEDDWPDLLYTDEDHWEDGRRVQPVFKPGYSPDLLASCMYMGHLLVARRHLLDEVGWLRSAFDGSQDYDLALRITAHSRAVRHLPQVLYHWRRHAGSTSAGPAAKPYARHAGLRAVMEAVSAHNPGASVENGRPPNSYRVRWPVPAEARASIIICSRTPKLLRRAIAAVERKTSHAAHEFVVVRHEQGNASVWDSLRLRREPVWVPYYGPFNFARMNNLAARQASGDVLVFLNDDVTPISRDWLSDLMAHALRPEVAVAGARLVYPSGAIQHAGLVTGIGQGVGHIHRDTFGSPYWNWLPFTRNVSAVTGACLAIRRSVFEELLGFDEAFPINYNDVDLCLRARRAGYEVIIEPHSVLRHRECRTRKPGIDFEERELWQERWARWLERSDFFYTPNLTRTREDASLDPEQPPLDPFPRP
ncbi:MAG TPA: glycosyltransferase [Bryobacteraceae bacterium]|nr:glycosyltransferase [Bryobacteraceae bacterium]